MPIYEYHCSNCDREFEKLVRFSDPNINSPECPHCSSENTFKRLSTVAAFTKVTAGAAAGSSCTSSGPFR